MLGSAHVIDSICSSAFAEGFRERSRDDDGGGERHPVDHGATPSEPPCHLLPPSWNTDAQAD